MHRTASEHWLLDATNRHVERSRRKRRSETRGGRRHIRQVLREVCRCAEEWFSGWWMP